ncbi:hypothetical protein [Streptomyces galilaeus]|uniref:hypothetical protein n=1 Tax=Streptomyces galilaeus TaxID=33899 RepID=UPI0016726D33|nr:hypothetical protein [Streptomyces galilaeus]GGW82713.1 hypothetical protein GCM10010350_79370 [Streptomyces galilaeus]
MRSSTDRVAELFGSDEVRSLLATNFPGYESYAFSELARAARDQLANTPAHSVGILARELRRSGLAIHHARDTGEQAGQDAALLVTFTLTGCDWWATTTDLRLSKPTSSISANSCSALATLRGRFVSL